MLREARETIADKDTELEDKKEEIMLLRHEKEELSAENQVRLCVLCPRISHFGF